MLKGNKITQHRLQDCTVQSISLDQAAARMLLDEHQCLLVCRLMQRLLADLVDCGSVTYEAVQHWQHDNKDETPGKEAAIKDSAKLVASLAAKDAENTDINN